MTDAAPDQHTAWIIEYLAIASDRCASAADLTPAATHDLVQRTRIAIETLRTALATGHFHARAVVQAIELGAFMQMIGAIAGPVAQEIAQRSGCHGLSKPQE